MIEELLFKTGVPTYKTTLQIDLPAAAQTQNNLAQKAPTNIGWIYGISVNIDGPVPTEQAKTLISLADAGGLWLVFKIQSNLFIDTLRLSNLVYTQNNVARTQSYNYMPCSIPASVDWQKSFVYNPAGVVNRTILFDLWYIDIPTYATLTKSGVLWQYGQKPSAQ